MRQNFQVEGENRELQWEKLQSPFRLKLGEETLEVVHHRPGFCLLGDGRCLRYSAVYQSAQQEWTLQWQGQPYVVKLLRANRSGTAGGAQDGLVKSPMNGVVVKVSAQAGDQVEAGQVILVLEAMKMENEVAAPVAGKLSRIEVGAGQVVGAQQLLFEVEPHVDRL
ncbi:MAG: biotin/lipoyl-binding protein [Candidatus Eremiobacteraeota bacterium]|nr:biotin/lipoyl-binding protein [Candidatus Eremiobacteraeota bacterium]MCW5870459.1 biotin/lipoyl-binding protein [Candidatus Eremiobacteraeota bacterium]